MAKSVSEQICGDGEGGLEDMEGQANFLGNGGSLFSHLACHEKLLELARSL